MINEVYEVINENSANRIILTCEHASNAIPEEYHNLGLKEFDLNRHISFDKGCKEITQKLAEKLGCFAIIGKYSRLLIDLNRQENDEDLIVEESDKTLIHGNLDISETERKSRIKKYHRPYYNQIEEQILAIQNQGLKPIILSVHSYTPQLRGGTYRPWDAGILCNKPQKLADYLYQELRNNTHKNIGKNVPYDMCQYDTGAAVYYGEGLDFDYAVLEIKDIELNECGIENWSNLLAKLLDNYQNDDFYQNVA